MKKLDLSSVSSTNQFPVKEGTIDFLQFAYQEALTALGNNLLGNKAVANVGYLLYGCVNSGSGLNYIISAGAVYYNGEIYLVPAATFTAAAGQVAVANIVVTQYTTNADPVVFTDATSRNVHNIRSINFSSGVSGSGIFDFASLVLTVIGLNSMVVASMPASYTVTFEQDKAIFFQSATSSVTINFDFTNAVPGAVQRLKWTFGAGLTLTINTPSGATIIRDSGNLAGVASANNLLYLVYLGKNDIGNDEVSYTLKQF
ncbi:MAG TPA: hypothetical protein VN722_08475 [Hanamia sp.]|nr:hypothetical protein [Hanamia sp.]